MLDVLLSLMGCGTGAERSVSPKPSTHDLRICRSTSKSPPHINTSVLPPDGAIGQYLPLLTTLSPSSCLHQLGLPVQQALLPFPAKQQTVGLSSPPMTLSGMRETFIFHVKLPTAASEYWSNFPLAWYFHWTTHSYIYIIIIIISSDFLGKKRNRCSLLLTVATAVLMVQAPCVVHVFQSRVAHALHITHVFQ